MKNFNHIGAGKEFLLELLKNTGPNVKHWLKIHPTKTPNSATHNKSSTDKPQ